MVKPKANIQWAPGTRLSRMNKEDGQYEYEMELLRNKKMEEAPAPKPQVFFDSELVWHNGELTFLGKVDPNGHWVEWRNAKVDPACFKKLPDWFEDEYCRLEAEMGGQH